MTEGTNMTMSYGSFPSQKSLALPVGGASPHGDSLLALLAAGAGAGSILAKDTNNYPADLARGALKGVSTVGGGILGHLAAQHAGNPDASIPGGVLGALAGYGASSGLTHLLGLNGQPVVHPQLKMKKRPVVEDWSQVPKTAVAWYDNAVKPYTELYHSLKAGESCWFDLETHKRCDEPGDLFVVPVSKRAEVATPVAHALSLQRNPVNNLFGGPTPMATTLTGSALGAGVGYLGGAALEKIIPSSVLEPGKLRKRLATIGGVLGAGPGLYLGRLGAHADDKGILESMVTPGVLSGEKQADAGGMWLDRVPVDAFNRLVMSDPFTPAPVQVGTAALIAAADRSRGGSGIVTPMDLARIAVGAGAGYLQAYAGAKVLGQLAGLSQPAQRALQQTGFFAGALKSVVPRMFGL